MSTQCLVERTSTLPNLDTSTEELRNMTSGEFPRIQRRHSSVESLRDRDGGSSLDNTYPARLLNNYGKSDPNFPNPRHIDLNRVQLTDEHLGALSEHAHGQSMDLSLTVNCCNMWSINKRNYPSPRIKVSEFAIYGDEESGNFNAVVLCQIWTWLTSILDHESLRAVYVDADAESGLEFLKTVSNSTQLSSRLECLEMITYEEFEWKELYLCLNQCTSLRRLRIAGDNPPKEFDESARLQCKLLAYDGPVELIPFVFNSYETLISLSLTAGSKDKLADRYIVDKVKMYRDKLPMHTIRFLRVYVGRSSLGPLLKDVSTLFVNLEALQISTRFSQYGSLLIRPAELYKVLTACNWPHRLRYLDIEGLLRHDCQDQLVQMGFRSLQYPFVRLSEMTLDNRVEEIWLNELTVDQKARCLDELRELLTAGVHPQFCPIDRF